MNGQKRVDDNASLFNGSFQVVPPTIRHNLFNGHSNCRIKVVQTHCLGHLTFTLPKNVQKMGAWVPMKIRSNEYSAPMAIEKIKILGAVLELPAKQYCQFGPFLR